MTDFKLRTGVLLLNVGSPAAPTPAALRPYLRQFLSDPRVLDIAAVPRWLLVNGVIAPFRAKHAAKAYSQIWTSEGSPLLVHTKALTASLSQKLGSGYRVEYAMCVGRPSINDRLRDLFSEPLSELIVLPLYPQYASATTGAAIDVLGKALRNFPNIPPLRILGAFYDQPDYLDALAAVITPKLDAFKPDHLLFSFHGLPERQIRKSESASGHCLARDYSCCAEKSSRNAFCYRAHCVATASQVVARLKLPADRWSLSFQSRLGRIPWIGPHTDETLAQLARRGARKLAVATPSFVSDCLETLEEIGIRGQRLFRASGGEALELLPCLNSSEIWVKALTRMISNPA